MGRLAVQTAAFLIQQNINPTPIRMATSIGTSYSQIRREAGFEIRRRCTRFASAKSEWRCESAEDRQLERVLAE